MANGDPNHLTIDEALQKAGTSSFTKEDAMRLIARSQGLPSYNGQLGHPLDHCEITLNAWPIPRYIQTPDLFTPGTGAIGDQDIIGNVATVDDFANRAGKSRHSFAWTDEHMILAVVDMLGGAGAFTALHNLSQANAPARLMFQRPTSHTTVMVTSATQTATGASSVYRMILDLCPPRRLHLQTLIPLSDGERRIVMNVRKPGQGQVFAAELDP